LRHQHQEWQLYMNLMRKALNPAMSEDFLSKASLLAVWVQEVLAEV
jgi:hypothetical protein